MFSFSCALWAIFFALFASVLRQIARYLPSHKSKNDSKTHPKSAHDKFKTVSEKQFLNVGIKVLSLTGNERGCVEISFRHSLFFVIQHPDMTA